MTSKVTEKVYDAFCLPFNALGAIAQNTDGLEKASKLFITCIDLLNKILEELGQAAVLTATMVLRGKLKIVAEVISGLSLISRLCEWICPAKGKDKPFWLEGKNNWKDVVFNPKTISRLFLTAAHAIEFAKFLDSCGIITLGKVASQTIGRIPVLGFVKDVFVVGSSIFDMGAQFVSLRKERPAYEKVKRKCKHWKEVARALDVSTEVNDKKTKERNGVKATLEAKIAGKCAKKVALYREKIQEVNLKLDGGDLLEADRLRLQNQLESLQTKENKWKSFFADDDNGLQGGLNGYAENKLNSAIQKQAAIIARKKAELNNRRFEGADADKNVVQALPKTQSDVSKLAQEIKAEEKKLEVLNYLQGIDGGAKVVVNHRYETLKAAETNGSRKVNKAWIALAYDVGKIAIIAFSIVGLAAGLVAMPWLMTVLVLGLIVNGMGVFKFLYDELIASEKNEKKAPVLAVPPEDIEE